MTLRVGLAIAHDAVRAVAVRLGRVVWAAEAPREPGAQLDACIVALLSEAPVPRWPRPLLSAAVGPHASQAKLVAGLPPVADTRTLEAILRESAASFFLKNGVPLIITGVRATGTGTALAAAIDESCVEAIRAACRARRWRLGPIAPAAVVLPLALEDQSFTWTDGRVVLEITRSEGALQSVRCRSAAAGEPVAAMPRPVEALAAVGADAVRYADAYGAAALRADEPLALDPDAAEVWSGAEFRGRLTLPVLLLLAGAFSAALSPLAARWSARRAEARLSAVRPREWQVVLTAFDQVDRATRILEDVRQFAASRSSVTTLLGDLARGLPKGSAVLSLQLDDGSGEVSILAPDAGAVLSAVKRIPGVSAVELVGAIRRETVSDGGLERVTVRFRTVFAADTTRRASP